jgi:hypothetical protein
MFSNDVAALWRRKNGADYNAEEVPNSFKLDVALTQVEIISNCKPEEERQYFSEEF